MRDRRPWFDLADDGLDEPDVAILGLPFDGSASLKPGAAEAPARLRAISRTSDAVTRRGRRVDGVTLRDFGDVSAEDDSGRALAQRTYLDAAARRLAALPSGSFLIALGGDNSISIPCLGEAARRHGGETGVIWFDAHSDLFESYDGNPDSHACALRRGITLAGIDPAGVVLLGTRSFSLAESEFASAQGIEVVTAADWWWESPDAVVGRVVKRLGGRPAVYLAVDIDGFDASCAPGTGYPMPGGVTSEMFFGLLERLVAALPIRAMDITEIAPPLDTNDVTAFLGTQVVLEALGALAAKTGTIG